MAIRAAGLLIAFAIAAFAAQDQRAQVPPPGGATPPPTFKSGVEYVEVDAVVANRQGQFVR